MRPFKDLPLARKALTLGVAPTMIAVLLVTVTSIVTTYFRARTNTLADLDGQASIVAQNVGGSLTVQDHQATAATLHALRGRVQVDRVCVYDAANRLFEGYSNASGACRSTLSRASGAGFWIVEVDQPITISGRMAGTVQITGSLVLFYGWIRSQMLAILGSLIAAILIALALTRRLQRAISEPVLSLARTADAVSATRDYTLRAARTTGDEVGGLVDSFNGMLDEIQRRTEALVVENAERKSAEESKDVFLAAVSHELRTPLNAIVGWLQIIRDNRPGPETMARALESLERNARSQARLIEDLLDVSRLAGGTFRMELTALDLREVVSSAVDIVTPSAAAADIDVRLVMPDRPCPVKGDADRLQQVVLNVLSNSVKFTPGGLIQVTVALDADRGQYTITVKDTGRGIPPEFLPKVFELFRQADGSTSRQHRGLGLGLAIAKQIASQHGGSIAVASDGAGKGTTLTLTLPRLEGATGLFATPIVAQTTAPSRPSLRNRRVLVVDDDPDGLEIAASALATANAMVTMASSGRQAIDLWTTAPFDVLVCDIAMPGVDGFEVLTTVAAHAQAVGQTVAAIAITAQASPAERARILAAGFRHHIAKPYSTGDLVQAVADVFRAATGATA